jgi:hypothetical protein
MSNNLSFIELLKKHTTIDKSFINTFFKKFKIGGELNFDLNYILVAKYLGIELITLKKRLLNTYSKTKRFFEKVDYIKIRDGHKLIYYLNYPAFEKLAMSGDSEKSEEVREYFVKLREFLTENQRAIYQTMENKEELKKYSKFETIYFFAVDERYPDIFKIGRATNILDRLSNYNVGRIKEVDLKYLALVKNNLLIENCMKLKLKKNQFIKGKEIYKIDPIMLVKIIKKCYCKYVSKQKNEELYKEISDLIGLCGYIKGKVNIKPYVIIGNEL